MDGFDATALVDGYVNDYRAFFHLLEHFSGDDARCLFAWKQYCADDEICARQSFFEVVSDRKYGANLTVENIIEITQAIKIEIEKCDASAKSKRNLGCVGSDYATTDDDDSTGLNTRNAAPKGYRDRPSASRGSWRRFVWTGVRRFHSSV